MQQPQEQEDALNEVNVIPLADLSLVLLIILMVLSPMAMQGLIQVTNGKAAAAQTKEELPEAHPEVPVIVSCEPGPQLKINGVVQDDTLRFAGNLETMLAKRRDKAVNLTASPTVPHGTVVHVMDLIQHHGATTLVMLKWDAANAQMAAQLTAQAPTPPHLGAKS